MRSLDERKNEIFRRADKIKRKEKRIKTVILSVVPAAACFALIVAMIPGVDRDKSVDTDDRLPVVDIGSVTSADGHDTDSVYTADRMNLLMQIINDAENKNGNGGDPTDPENDGNPTGIVPPSNIVDPFTSSDKDNVEGYWIEFTDENGIEYEYLISENQITDILSNKSYRITEAQYRQLKEAFDFK